MFQAVFTYVVLACFLVGLTLTALSIPLGRDLDSPRKQKIRGSLPWVIGVLSVTGAAILGYGYLQAQAEAESLSYEDFQKRVSHVSGDTKPYINYSAAGNLMSIIYGVSPGAGIECSQVRPAAPGVWDIVGSIEVNGVTISQSRIGLHSISAGGVDVASAIGSKCGRILKMPTNHAGT